MSDDGSHRGSWQALRPTPFALKVVVIVIGVILIAGFAVGLSVAAAQSAEPSMSAITTELLELGKADQEVRERYAAVLRSSPLIPSKPSAEFLAMVKEMNRIDAKNMLRLEQIVEHLGWPGAELVGKEASGAAWLVLQHAPLDAQLKYLPLLKAAAAKGNARKADVAMMEDRILVAQGMAQRYGTQVEAAPDGSWVVHEVEDPGRVAGLRAEVGLPPMDEYLQRGEKELGRPIGRGNLLVDPSPK